MPETVSHAEIVRRIERLETDRATKEALKELATQIERLGREVHSLRNTAMGFLGSLTIALIVAVITLLTTK